MEKTKDEQQSEKIIKLDKDIFYMGKELGKLEKTVVDGFSSLHKKFDDLDNRYAGKGIEEEVKTIKEKQEKRNYDWLRYAIMTAITILVGFVGLIKFN